MPNQLPLLPLILDDVPPGFDRALAQEGVPFQRHVAGPVKGRFLLFDSRRGRRAVAAAGQKLIDIDRLRRPPPANTPGSSSTLFGFDPFEALIDQKSARCQWQIAGFDICEEIARFDKREIRRELMARLRRSIEERGGVWIRAAAFPFPYRSAFNFRIDYDHFDPLDFNATLDAIRGQEDATTHFVNAAVHDNGGDADNAWRRFQGLDVGSHGYWHHTYRSEEENLHNIRRGMETIESHGIAASGFAAPMGRFNPELLSALAKLNVSHSSEFALAYDELPFVMGESGIVQIPIHPICLALFLDAAEEGALSPSVETARIRSAVNAATEHLVSTARRRYRAGEPVFLYGHPTGRLGRHPQLLSEVFGAVSEFGAVWKTTMSRFAEWWRARLAASLSVSRRGEQFVVSANNLPRNYRFGIEYFRGRHVALIPLERPMLCFSPSALAYENREARREARCDDHRGLRPVRVDRPHGIKGRIRRLIDWERVTPVEEIAATSWQNLAKRTLRQWWRP